MGPKVGIGVIVISEEQRILCGRRCNAHGAGDWAFPGGHLEYGETPEEGAARELLEETGMLALSIRRGPWVNNLIEGKHYITLMMIVDKFSDEPCLCEPEKCAGWAWYPVGAMPTPLFPSIRSLLAEYPLSAWQKNPKVDR